MSRMNNAPTTPKPANKAGGKIKPGRSGDLKSDVPFKRGNTKSISRKRSDLDKDFPGLKAGGQRARNLATRARLSDKQVSALRKAGNTGGDVKFAPPKKKRK